MTGSGAHSPWGGSGIEPRLAELLVDPIVQAVMRSDGVSPAALQLVIARVRSWLRQAGSAGLSGRDLAHADIAVREIPQRVEDALLDAGRKEIAVATEYGTFEWRTNWRP